MAKTRFEVRNGVAFITMDDPARLNALDIPMDDELLAHLETCEHAPEVKVIVLAGEGRAFSSGGDMAYFKKNLDQQNYGALAEVLIHVNRLMLQMKTMRKLIVAAVQGHASGGGANLALAADFIIAAPDVKLTQSFTKIGLAPDAGGMYLLSRAIGARRALELCTSARTVEATEALAMGLVTEIAEPGQHRERAEAFACELAGGPLLAYELTKQQNYAVNYSGFAHYLAVTEKETVNRTFQSADFAECVSAFIEKRKPEYKGK